MIKLPAALFVGLLVAAGHASAQVATLPVQSFGPTLTADTKVKLSVGIFGFTSNSSMPRVLSNQSYELSPSALLQREVCAKVLGYQNSSMTVMQLVLKSSVDARTFQTTAETVMPKTPVQIRVKRGEKLWVVYTPLADQQATLRFYVGTPPSGATTCQA
jgi:hypothetical protein